MNAVIQVQPHSVPCARQRRTWWMPLVFGAALVGGASGVARASDAGAGLDLTMEVIGKDERLDERVINRILIPGVPPASGNAEDAAAVISGESVSQARCATERDLTTSAALAAMSCTCDTKGCNAKASIDLEMVETSRNELFSSTCTCSCAKETQLA